MIVTLLTTVLNFEDATVNLNPTDSELQFRIKDLNCTKNVRL